MNEKIKRNLVVMSASHPKPLTLPYTAETNPQLSDCTKPPRLNKDHAAHTHALQSGIQVGGVQDVSPWPRPFWRIRHSANTRLAESYCTPHLLSRGDASTASVNKFTFYGHAANE